MSILKSKFGVTKEGKEVTKYTLKNTNGLEVSFNCLGGVITNIMMPDKDGNVDDIVLGYDKVSDYEVNMPGFGCSNRKICKTEPFKCIIFFKRQRI